MAREDADALLSLGLDFKQLKADLKSLETQLNQMLGGAVKLVPEGFGKDVSGAVEGLKKIEKTAKEASAVVTDTLNRQAEGAKKAGDATQKLSDQQTKSADATNKADQAFRNLTQQYSALAERLDKLHKMSAAPPQALMDWFNKTGDKSKMLKDDLITLDRVLQDVMQGTLAHGRALDSSLFDKMIQKANAGTEALTRMGSMAARGFDAVSKTVTDSDVAMTKFNAKLRDSGLVQNDLVELTNRMKAGYRANAQEIELLKDGLLSYTTILRQEAAAYKAAIDEERRSGHETTKTYDQKKLALETFNSYLTVQQGILRSLDSAEAAHAQSIQKSSVEMGKAAVAAEKLNAISGRMISDDAFRRQAQGVRALREDVEAAERQFTTFTQKAEVLKRELNELLSRRSTWTTDDTNAYLLKTEQLAIATTRVGEAEKLLNSERRRSTIELERNATEMAKALASLEKLSLTEQRLISQDAFRKQALGVRLLREELDQAEQQSRQYAAAVEHIERELRQLSTKASQPGGTLNSEELERQAVLNQRLANAKMLVAEADKMIVTEMRRSTAEFERNTIEIGRAAASIDKLNISEQRLISEDSFRKQQMNIRLMREELERAERQAREFAVAVELIERELRQISQKKIDQGGVLDPQDISRQIVLSQNLANAKKLVAEADRMISTEAKKAAQDQDTLKKQILELTKAEEKLAAVGLTPGNKLSSALKGAKDDIVQTNNAMREATREAQKMIDAHKGSTGIIDGFTNSLGRATRSVLSYGIAWRAMNFALAIPEKIAEIDKQITMLSATMVGHENRVDIVRQGTEAMFNAMTTYGLSTQHAGELVFELNKAIDSQSARQAALGPAIALTTLKEVDQGDAIRVLVGLYRLYGDSISGATTDAEKFSAISDQLIKASAISVGSIKGMTEAMQLMAAQAKFSGLGLTESLAMVTLLNDALVKNGRAGSEMSRVLQVLQTDAVKVARAFEIPNVTVDDTVDAFDMLRKVMTVIRADMTSTGVISVGMAQKIKEAFGTIQAERALEQLALSWDQLPDRMEKIAKSAGTTSDVLKVLQGSVSAAALAMANEFLVQFDKFLSWIQGIDPGKQTGLANFFHGIKFAVRDFADAIKALPGEITPILKWIMDYRGVVAGALTLVATRNPVWAASAAAAFQAAPFPTIKGPTPEERADQERRNQPVYDSATGTFIGVSTPSEAEQIQAAAAKQAAAGRSIWQRMGISTGPTAYMLGMGPSMAPKSAGASGSWGSVGASGSWDVAPKPLEEQAKIIAEAIRQVETGGRFVQGESGEMGAFQFMPGTWKAVSQEIAGSVLPQTPENEYNVAVGKIQSLLAKGHSARDIALIWNSSLAGTEQPLEVAGVNKQGVAYDSKAYADKVMAAIGVRADQLLVSGGGGPGSPVGGAAPAAMVNEFGERPAWKGPKERYIDVWDSFGRKLSNYELDSMFPGRFTGESPLAEVERRRVEEEKAQARKKPIGFASDAEELDRTRDFIVNGDIADRRRLLGTLDRTLAVNEYLDTEHLKQRIHDPTAPYRSYYTTADEDDFGFALPGRRELGRVDAAQKFYDEAVKEEKKLTELAKEGKLSGVLDEGGVKKVLGEAASRATSAKSTLDNITKEEDAFRKERQDKADESATKIVDLELKAQKSIETSFADSNKTMTSESSARFEKIRLDVEKTEREILDIIKEEGDARKYSDADQTSAPPEFTARMRGLYDKLHERERSALDRAIIDDRRSVGKSLGDPLVAIDEGYDKDTKNFNDIYDNRKKAFTKFYEDRKRVAGLSEAELKELERQAADDSKKIEEERNDALLRLQGAYNLKRAQQLVEALQNEGAQRRAYQLGPLVLSGAEENNARAEGAAKADIAYFNERLAAQQQYQQKYLAMLNERGMREKFIAAQAIEEDKRVLQAKISTLQTLNNAEMDLGKLRASAMEEIAIQNNSVAGIVVANFAKMAYSGDSFLRSFSNALYEIMGQIKSSLADNLFEFFKNGTFDMKKAWESLLDSMLRTIADFLADTLIKQFLQFVTSFLVGGSGGGLASSLGGAAATAVGGSAGAGILGSLLGVGGQAASGAAGGAASGLTGSATSAGGGLLGALWDKFTGKYDPSKGGDTSTYYSDSFTADGTPIGSLVNTGGAGAAAELAMYQQQYGWGYQNTYQLPQFYYDPGYSNWTNFNTFTPDFSWDVYDKGGMVEGAIGAARPAIVHGGELVIPAEELRKNPFLYVAEQLGAPQFATGGFVPGPQGTPVPAVVHGGELIIPSSMLTSQEAFMRGMPGLFSRSTAPLSKSQFDMWLYAQTRGAGPANNRLFDVVMQSSAAGIVSPMSYQGGLAEMFARATWPNYFGAGAGWSRLPQYLKDEATLAVANRGGGTSMPSPVRGMTTQPSRGDASGYIMDMGADGGAAEMFARATWPNYFGRNAGWAQLPQYLKDEATEASKNLPSGNFPTFPPFDNIYLGGAQHVPFTNGLLGSMATPLPMSSGSVYVGAGLTGFDVPQAQIDQMAVSLGLPAGSRFTGLARGVQAASGGTVPGEEDEALAALLHGGEIVLGSAAKSALADIVKNFNWSTMSFGSFASLGGALGSGLVGGGLGLLAALPGLFGDSTASQVLSGMLSVYSPVLTPMITGALGLSSGLYGGGIPLAAEAFPAFANAVAGALPAGAEALGVGVTGVVAGETVGGAAVGAAGAAAASTAAMAGITAGVGTIIAMLLAWLMAPGDYGWKRRASGQKVNQNFAPMMYLLDHAQTRGDLDMVMGELMGSLLRDSGGGQIAFKDVWGDFAVPEGHLNQSLFKANQRVDRTRELSLNFQLLKDLGQFTQGRVNLLDVAKEIVHGVKIDGNPYRSTKLSVNDTIDEWARGIVKVGRDTAANYGVTSEKARFAQFEAMMLGIEGVHDIERVIAYLQNPPTAMTPKLNDFGGDSRMTEVPGTPGTNVAPNPYDTWLLRAPEIQYGAEGYAMTVAPAVWTPPPPVGVQAVYQNLAALAGTQNPDAMRSVYDAYPIQNWGGYSYDQIAAQYNPFNSPAYWTPVAGWTTDAAGNAIAIAPDVEQHNQELLYPAPDLWNYSAGGMAGGGFVPGGAPFVDRVRRTLMPEELVVPRPFAQEFPALEDFLGSLSEVTPARISAREMMIGHDVAQSSRSLADEFHARRNETSSAGGISINVPVTMASESQMADPAFWVQNGLAIYAAYQAEKRKRR
jgi:hypothetical protein